MAGIFQSMLYGMNQKRSEQRQQAEDEFMAGERAYQQQRRSVTDGREDTAWQDGREDRAYEVDVQRPLQTEDAQLGVQSKRFAVGRQPVEAQQQDARFSQQQEAGALSNQAARFQVGRQTVEARQQDARFGVDMQAAQQGVIGRQLQIGSAQRAAQIEEAQQPDKLDEIRIERERKGAMDALAKAGQQFVLTGMQGDKQRAAQLINQTWAQATDDADGDAGVRVNDEGKYYLEGPDGKPVLMLGDEDQVMQYAFQFLSDPVTFAQSRQATYAARAAAQSEEASARAKDPRKFVETAQQPDGTMALIDRSTGQAKAVTGADGQPFRGAVPGQGGSAPAKLQVAQAYFERMQRQPGETDSDAWIRAFHESNQRSETSPNVAARDFYASTLRALTQNAIGAKQQEQAQQVAAQMTQDYMGKFFPGQDLPLEDLSAVEDEMSAPPAQPAQQSASGLLRGISPTLGAAADIAGRVAGGRQSSQPQRQSSASPYPEGTELQGPDGRAYVVRNGQPVPKQ